MMPLVERKNGLELGDHIYLFISCIYTFYLHLHGVVNEGSNWGVLDFFLFLDNLV